MREWVESITTSAMGEEPINVTDRCAWFNDQESWAGSVASALKFLAGETPGKKQLILEM